MGKKRSSSEELPTWFKRFFGDEIGGLVELRVFPNQRGKMEARAWVEDAESFCDFVNSYNDKESNLAIYFGPAVRHREGGTKADAGYTNVLWAEVDCDKLGWDSIKTARLIHNLPGALQPSLCIHSGHGIHLYWYLSEPSELNRTGEFSKLALQTNRIEGTNKLLRDMVSGDNVWNIDRVMRVPWTWNTKARPVQSRVVWHYHWHRNSIKEIHDAVADFDRVLTETGFIPREKWERLEAQRLAEATDPDKVYSAAYGERRKTTNARGLSIWNQCRYGGGPGYVGLDEAIMLYTAYEYCRLTLPTQEKLDRIVDDTVAKVREVHARDASGESWDWNEETREVRAKLMRWVRRWGEIQNVERQRGGRKAVRKVHT